MAADEPSPDLFPLATVLRLLADVLGELKIDWYLLGALAAQVHGVVRSTGDVDVTVRLGKITPVQLAARLASAGFQTIFDDKEFISASRVIPVRHAGTGVAVDILLAGLGLEDRFMARAMIKRVAGIDIPVASAEDLLIMKVLAAREKDLSDCRAILRAGTDEIDKAYVEATIRELEEALSQNDLMPIWRRVLGSTQQ